LSLKFRHRPASIPKASISWNFRCNTVKASFFPIPQPSSAWYRTTRSPFNMPCRTEIRPRGNFPSTLMAPYTTLPVSVIQQVVFLALCPIRKRLTTGPIIPTGRKEKKTGNGPEIRLIPLRPLGSASFKMRSIIFGKRK